MSFEILEAPAQTVYAPLNTTIDADRDYYNLTGLDASAQDAPQKVQLGGFYQGEELTPGMLGQAEEKKDPMGRLLVIMAVMAVGGIAMSWLGRPDFER